MTMNAAQRRANKQAHQSLAQTRRVARYLQALQDRQDYVDALAALDADLPTLEQAFIGAAKGYAERKGYTLEDWLELGVDPALLRKAGIK